MQILLMGLRNAADSVCIKEAATTLRCCQPGLVLVGGTPPTWRMNTKEKTRVCRETGSCDLPDAPPVTIATFPENLLVAAVERRSSPVRHFFGSGEVISAIFRAGLQRRAPKARGCVSPTQSISAACR